MSIEAATYVNDLQPVNPPSSDPRSQGDDHLRLIKQVLQNTFTGAIRAFNIPTTLAKTANYSVAKADGESVIYCNTGGGVVTFTLPTLASGDQGWKVDFIKTSSDVNPMFIAPPSGNLSSGQFTGLAKARRCIPGIRITAVWDGTAFFVTRALALPVGSCVEFHGSSLPAGYEWPNGQTLASVATNYPEFNAAMGSGVTLDKRGRVGITLDNLGGSAAGRLAGGIITGTAVGNVGGSDVIQLARSDLPNVAPSWTGSSSAVSGNTAGDVLVGSGSEVGGVNVGAGSATAFSGGSSFSFTSASISGTVTPNGTVGSINGNVSQTSHSNVQPSIMVSQILVVE